MKTTRWTALLAAVILAAGCQRVAVVRKAVPTPERHMPARAEGATLRVASFNILWTGNRKHPWEKRREAVVDCLRDIDADIFGLQEAEWAQLLYVMDALPGYSCTGRGRDDGLLRGEFTPLFYRTNRFVVLSAETFWLSDTPELPGSNTWNAACNRVATIAILIDRTDGTSLGICVTHMDHVSEQARRKGSALIRRRIARYGDGLAWVVMGDFNARPGSVPHNNLVGPGGKVQLLDTFAAANPNAPAETSSFHGYAGRPSPGQRIDWVLATADLQALAAGICKFKYRGIYPSDHFPVWADLKRVGANKK